MNEINIDNLHCLADLHLHLDGALTLNNIKNLAAIQGIEIKDSDEEILNKIQVDTNCKSLLDFLEKFAYPLSFLQTKEGIYQSIINLSKELKDEGLMYAEVRFAPQLHLQKGLTQEDVAKIACEAVKHTAIKINLIFCCMRGNNNQKENLETLKVAKKYLNKGVVAVDLAGAENLYKTEEFLDLFKVALNLNLPFTIHAGESDGASSIRSGIRMGAARIGHGLRAFEDLSVMNELKEKHIPLELCLTSNINTCALDKEENFPIKKYLDFGIPVTLNTDDKAISNVTLKSEYKLVKKILNLSDSDIKQFLINAIDCSFLSNREKEFFRKKILSEIG